MNGSRQTEPDAIDDVGMPDGWESRTLGELADEERGITYGIVQPGHHVSDGVPIIRVQNIVDGTLETSDVMRVAPEIAAKYRRTCLRGGELLLSLVGSVGSSVITPPEFAGWNTARAVAVVPLRAGIDARWVRFCLRSAPLQHLMEVWCNTTVQATLNLKDVTRLPIPLPPPREREAIVAVLGALDDKIELNRRMNRTLEELAGALFRAWFVDFEPVVAQAAGRAPLGLASAVAALFPASFTDSELGLIPQGWEARSVQTVFDIRDGKTLPARIRHETGRYIAFGANGEMARCDVATTEQPCVILGKIGSCGALHRSVEPCWVTNNAFCIQPGAADSLEFTWSTLREIDFAAFIGGSANPYMPLKNFGFERVLFPPAELRSAFERTTSPWRRMVEHNVRESRTLAALRDTLLPKLLSGVLRVKAAEKRAGTTGPIT
jgi:type I restriction enzyme S subunit